jgi:hypothetical protein
MFWAYTFCVLPFLLLAGILSLLKIMPVTLNGIPRYGIEGFAISILSIPFTGLLFSVFNWLALNFGNFIYNGFMSFVKKKSN